MILRLNLFPKKKCKKIRWVINIMKKKDASKTVALPLSLSLPLPPSLSV